MSGIAIPGQVEGIDPIHIDPQGRISLGQPDAATQPAWFIDPVGGDNGAVGDTALTPIQTFQEFADRIGDQVIDVAMTLSIMDDMASDNPMYGDFMFGPNGSLVVIGIKPTTILYTGAFTAVTPISNVADGAQKVEDTSSTFPVGLLNTQLILSRIRITGGANEGAVAYPTKDLGANVARTSAFSVVPTTFQASAGAVFPISPAIADPFVVETGLTFIAEMNLTFRYPSANFMGGLNPRVAFFHLAGPNTPSVDPDTSGQFGPGWTVQGIGPLAGVEGVPNLVQFYGCDVGHAQPFHTHGAFFNCKLSGVTATYASGAMCVIGGLITAEVQLRMVDQCVFTLDTLVDLGGLIEIHGGNTAIGRMGIYDAPAGAGLSLLLLSRVLAIAGGLLYGTGNTSYGVGIRAGAHMTFRASGGGASKPVIQGTVSDLRLNNQVATLWTGFGNDFVYAAAQCGISGSG